LNNCKYFFTELSKEISYALRHAHDGARFPTTAVRNIYKL